ncbi:MAG: MarR family transcriptional regulator [Steroidobacteraceae bacterium]
MARRDDTSISQTDLRTLAYLSRMEGCTQRELATAIELTPITLGRQVDHLARAGLVERRPHPSDRRAVRLYLTSRARPRVDRIRTISAQVAAHAMRELSDTDRDELMRLLGIVHDSLLERGQQSNGQPGSRRD